MYCRHCINSDEHTYVCDCDHHHNDHVYGGGCKIKKCECMKYSQVKRRKAGDRTDKEIRPNSSVVVAFATGGVS